MLPAALIRALHSAHPLHQQQKHLLDMGKSISSPTSASRLPRFFSSLIWLPMRSICSGLAARASRRPDSVEPAGATTTQRLSCSGTDFSSTNVKPSIPTQNVIASPYLRTTSDTKPIACFTSLKVCNGEAKQPAVFAWTASTDPLRVLTHAPQHKNQASAGSSAGIAFGASMPPS